MEGLVWWPLKDCSQLLAFVLLCCCSSYCRGVSSSQRRSQGSGQPIAGNNMRRIDWSKEGVSDFTDSNPFYVGWREILKFQCEQTDKTSLIYLLRPEEFEKIRSGCSASEIVDTQSLCRPPAIADCRQEVPEKRVSGAQATEFSCTVASFRPDRMYYLANFPFNNSQLCQFAVPIKVCPNDGTDCPPSSLPTPLPSISTTLPVLPTSLSPPRSDPSPTPIPSLAPLSITPSPSLPPTTSAAGTLTHSMTLSLSLLIVSFWNHLF